MPTTGVADGAFVQVTVTGGNFLPGGVLTLTERTGNATNLVQGALTAAGVEAQVQLTRASLEDVFVAATLAERTPAVGASP